MVMGIVYPTLKPVLEASIRRITIVVHWNHGPNPQRFELVQYVTDPQRSAFNNGLGAGDGGIPGPPPFGAAGSRASALGGAFTSDGTGTATATGTAH